MTCIVVRDSDHRILYQFDSSDEIGDGIDLTGCTVYDPVPLDYDGTMAFYNGTSCSLDLISQQNAAWDLTKEGRDVRDFDNLTNAKGTYQGDLISQVKLWKASFLAQNNIGTWPINWVMADNTKVPHTQAEIIAAWGDFCMRSLGVTDASQNIRTDIYTETDPEAVKSLDIDEAYSLEGY